MVEQVCNALWAFIPLIIVLMGIRFILTGKLSTKGSGTGGKLVNATVNGFIKMISSLMSGFWSGTRRVALDTHTYCFSRWPGRTLIGYAVFTISIVGTLLYYSM